MKSSRGLLTGLISAAASVLVVIGALSLALAEGFTLAVPTPLPTSTSIEIPMPEVTAALRSSATPAPTPVPVLVTATIPFAITCPVPANWDRYTIQTGDTLAGLAIRRGTTVETLMQANCLVTQALMVDTLIYLPPKPTKTPAASPTASPTSPAPNVYPTITNPAPTCGIPLGWVRYIVQPGDTLFKLSIAAGTSVQQIQLANCMGSSTLIRVGEVLWLPRLPLFTSTTAPTATSIPPSATPRPPSATPTTATTPPDVVPSQTNTPEPTVAPSATPITPGPTITETLVG